MNKRDLLLVTGIGALVGILVQPIIANVIRDIHNVIPAPIGVIRTGSFVLFLLLAPFALFAAAQIGRFVPVIYQFAKFAAVGTLNSFVDLGVFNLETFLLGTLPTDITFAVFKAISFFIATTNSYVWNKYWTFGVTRTPEANEVVKFYSIAIAGGFLNVGVATLVKIAGGPAVISPELWINVIAPIAGIFSVFIWNFMGYKFFVFKR